MEISQIVESARRQIAEARPPLDHHNSYEFEVFQETLPGQPTERLTITLLLYQDGRRKFTSATYRQGIQLVEALLWKHSLGWGVNPKHADLRERFRPVIEALQAEINV